MCMTNTEGIDHIIPVMLADAGQAKFGPLHGIWSEEQINEARRHLSYILINSKNYSNAKQQVNAAWSAKLSPRNIRSTAFKQLDNEFVSEDSDDSNEVPMDEVEAGNLTAEDSYISTQYIQDGDDKATGCDELSEKQAEDGVRYDSENVFMSLVQDFGKKFVKEEWVSVGGIRCVRQNRRRDSPKSQFFVILKGIGSETYKCLEDIAGETDDKRARRDRTRSYLRELQRARVEYVEKVPDEPMSFVGGMQNLPLVYGEAMLGSQKWDTLRRKA